MPTISSLKNLENKYDVYRGKDFMKKSLSNQANKSSRNYMKKKSYICKETFKHESVKKYPKVRDHCHYTKKYRGAAQSICILKYSIAAKVHLGSNYGYHFVIKMLPEKFEK